MAPTDLPTVKHLLKAVVEPRSSQALDFYVSEPSEANRFGVGLVAESEGEVVGVVAGAGIGLHLPGLHVSEQEIARRIGLLDVLAIRPDHRRQGLGSLLCGSLLDRFRDGGHQMMVTMLAAGRRDLIPVYTGWGWNVGVRGAGVGIEIGPHQIAIAEDPAARTAWTALAPGVRAVPVKGLGVPVVTGIFG